MLRFSSSIPARFASVHSVYALMIVVIDRLFIVIHNATLPFFRRFKRKKNFPEKPFIQYELRHV